MSEGKSMGRHMPSNAASGQPRPAAVPPPLPQEESLLCPMCNECQRGRGPIRWTEGQSAIIHVIHALKPLGLAKVFADEEP